MDNFTQWGIVVRCDQALTWSQREAVVAWMGAWRRRRKEVDGPRKDAGDKAPTMRQAALWQYISEECSRLEMREKAS